MNKKTLGIIGVILVIILLIICSTITPKEKDTNELSDDMNVIITNAQQESEEFSNSSEQKDFTEINATTYLEYYNGEEEKIILIARPTCHYCQIAEPILHRIAYEYDLEINYLNTDEFKDEDASIVMNSDELFAEGFGTPLLLSLSNGKINDTVDGLTDYAHYVEFFKKNKYIK